MDSKKNRDLLSKPKGKSLTRSCKKHSKNFQKDLKKL